MPLPIANVAAVTLELTAGKQVQQEENNSLNLLDIRTFQNGTETQAAPLGCDHELSWGLIPVYIPGHATINTV